jgi:hypothetical protein
MNTLLIVVGVIAVILLLTGGLVQSLNFLLWVGVVLIVIAVIAYLVRNISGRRNVSPSHREPAPNRKRTTHPPESFWSGQGTQQTLRVFSRPGGPRSVLRRCRR